MTAKGSGMDLQWVLYGHIPKIGMEKRFRELEEAFVEMTYDSSLTEEQKDIFEKEYRKKLTQISRTPKDFDPKFEKAHGIIDGGRIHKCMLLPVQLRARALNEQTAIEAIDFGIKIMQTLRVQHEDKTTIVSDKTFAIEREFNFLRNTATCLLTWGKRGFGYFVLR
jgi:hypothetical protein